MKLLRQGAASCIDKEPIQVEPEALHIVEGNFLVWLFVHEASASVELSWMASKRYHSVVESKRMSPEDPPLALR